MKFFKSFTLSLLILTFAVSLFGLSTELLRPLASNTGLFSSFEYGLGGGSPNSDNTFGEPAGAQIVEGPWALASWNITNTNWLNQFNKPVNQSRIPYIYLYQVAGKAQADKGIDDCNNAKDLNNTLCKKGANYIRENTSSITQAYLNTANQIKSIYGITRPVLLHLEPDFYQYAENGQEGGPLTPGQASTAMNNWTSSIKSILPNSQLVMDVSTWNKDLAPWSANLQNFDYAGMVGKRFDLNGDGSVPAGIDGKTYKQISQMTGKKLIVNDAHGPGGDYLPYNKNWENRDLVSARWTDGVVAVIMPPNDINSLTTTVNILSQNPISGSSLSSTSSLASLISSSSTSQINNLENSFKKPFGRDSIWNRPIISTATYSNKIGFRSPQEFPNIAPDWQGGIGVDEEPIGITTTGDPIVDVYQITDWGNRCNTTQSLNKKVRIPAGSIFKDPQESNNTPNYSGAFVQPDGSIFHFNAIATCGSGKIAVYDYTSDENNSLTKRGNEGGHGGSGLSGIGGSIRKGELISNDKITHAIKLNVFAKYYLYADPILCNNPNNPSGFQAPANRADSYAGCRDGNRGYRGQYAKLKMGALTALPKDTTVESLGVTNPIAKKLFQAFQDFGGYIVDDTGWNHYDIPMELGVQEEVLKATGINITPDNINNTYYQDMIKIIMELREVNPVIANVNSSSSSSVSQLASQSSVGLISSSVASVTSIQSKASSIIAESSASVVNSQVSSNNGDKVVASTLVSSPGVSSSQGDGSTSGELPRTGSSGILWGSMLLLSGIGLVAFRFSSKNSRIEM